MGVVMDHVAPVLLRRQLCRPTRLARHGTALVPDPKRRWRLDLTKAESLGQRRPVAEGCPCPHVANTPATICTTWPAPRN